MRSQFWGLVPAVVMVAMAARNASSDAASYNAYRHGEVASATSTSYIGSGLPEKTCSGYAENAVNPAGESDQPSAVAATPRSIGSRTTWPCQR